MTLAVGDPAPDFTLAADDGAADDGAEVSLHALRGQWLVVYFYPRDNTPGCTTEACDFRDHIAASDPAETPKILGISADSLKSHIKFRGKYDLPFSLLSDPDHVMMESWGVWAEKKNYGKTYMGIVRSTYIVDPEGNIAAAWRNIRVKNHVAKVMTKLAELQGIAVD